MPRIRTVKPEFWSDAKVSKLSLPARLLFLGLLNEADDEGRLLGSPKYLCGVVFPNDDDIEGSDVRGWLDELEAVGMARRYTVEDVVYVYLPRFRRHQRINRPSKSKLPSPGQGNPPPPGDSVNPHGGLQEGSSDPQNKYPRGSGSGSGSGTGRNPNFTHATRARGANDTPNLRSLDRETDPEPIGAMLQDVKRRLDESD